MAVTKDCSSPLDARENVLHGYQWRTKRKAELEEEQRKRKLEAERAEKKRQKRLERARVNRLLKDAAAFQQSSEIRKCVVSSQVKVIPDGSSSIEGSNNVGMQPL